MALAAAAALAVGATALPSLAGQVDRNGFDRFDLDHDGVVTLAEFARLDRDHDGAVSLDELLRR
jgi:Ca2+-binding EF-hand superfamily protein